MHFLTLIFFKFWLNQYKTLLLLLVYQYFIAKFLRFWYALQELGIKHMNLDLIVNINFNECALLKEVSIYKVRFLMTWDFYCNAKFSLLRTICLTKTSNNWKGLVFMHLFIFLIKKVIDFYFWVVTTSFHSVKLVYTKEFSETCFD